MALSSLPSHTKISAKVGSQLQLAYDFTSNDLHYNRTLRLSPRQVRRPILRFLQFFVLGGLILPTIAQGIDGLPFPPPQWNWLEILPILLIIVGWLVWRSGELVSMVLTLMMGLEKLEGELMKETDVEQDNTTAIVRYYGSIGDTTLSLTLSQFHALRAGQKYCLYLTLPLHTVLSIEAI